MSLAQVFENFIWRLEGIAPSSQADRGKLQYVDPEDDPSALRPRSFSLTWEGSDTDGSPTDLYDRWAVHTFTVEVYYPAGDTGLSNRDAHALSLADRDDICEALRDPAGWTGYDAGNTSTDIGLCDRKRESDEMERDEALYTLRMTWQCHVKEIEG
jgi:hypothetical protein